VRLQRPVMSVSCACQHVIACTDQKQTCWQTGGSQLALQHLKYFIRKLVGGA
jgi:hypothetical protein